MFHSNAYDFGYSIHFGVCASPVTIKLQYVFFGADLVLRPSEKQARDLDKEVTSWRLIPGNSIYVRSRVTP